MNEEATGVLFTQVNGAESFQAGPSVAWNKLAREVQYYLRVQTRQTISTVDVAQTAQCR